MTFTLIKVFSEVFVKLPLGFNVSRPAVDSIAIDSATSPDIEMNSSPSLTLIFSAKLSSADSNL